MGPASNPEATLDNLLDPLPYRMSERNSCWDGGKPDVSDAFASALWCTDYMLQCAQRGWSGVIPHGGGNGYYTPIAGAPSTGFTRRLEYYGILFARHFTGARFVKTNLRGAGPRVNAFVLDRNGNRELVLVNKTPDIVTCNLPSSVTAAHSLL